MSFSLHSLKERKVVEWLLAYLAGAFVVLQVMDALESALGLTPRDQQSVVILLATGLIVTLVVAWAHGEKGRQRPSAAEILVIAATLVVGVTAATIHWTGGDAEQVAQGPVLPDIPAQDSLSDPPADAAPDPAAAEPAPVPTNDVGVRVAPLAATLSPTTADIFTGDSLRLRLDSDAEGRWTSTNSSVARVTSDGLVLAMGPGTAEIIAAVAGAELSAEVTVRDVVAEGVEVGSVGPLQVGESARPTVEVSLSNGRSTTEIRVEWTSSDPTVAAVATDGTITARAGGSARIRAEIDGVVGSTPVTVVEAVASAALAAPPSEDVLFALLESYRKALESRDVAEVVVVHPTLTSEGRTRWEQLFRLGEIRVEFSDLRTRQVEADSAQVEFRQTLTGERIDANSTRFVAHLVPEGEGWVIDELRSLGPSG